MTAEVRGTPLSATEFASAVTAITSAFGDPTRREIYLFTHASDDGVTAGEVAEKFALHPNVARHHLDKLAAGGYVDITSSRPAGGAGRPSKRYRVTGGEVGVEIPVRTDEVIVRLLGRALAELGQERAEALAEEVGTEYGLEMADAMGTGSSPRSVRTALHTVADALSAHGFVAHAEREGDTMRIVAEHCPFGETAVEHPVMCAIDRGMVRGMLANLYSGETSVGLQSSRSMGDDSCVTSIDG